MMNDILKQINAGTSMPRNMFLFNNAIYLLPYTGAGSGITRALDEDVNVTFMNNDKAQEFVITVWREESNQVEVESNQVGNQVEEKSNQVEDLDTGLRHSDTDLDTGLRHSDTDHDTFAEDHDTFAEDHDTFVEDHDTFAEDHDTFVEDHDTFAEDHDTFAEDHDTFAEDHDTKRVPLTNKQKDIVNFCSVPRTSREILERAGVVYHTKNIAKYITSLVAAGYLQMTNPENPTASNQKYKKVNIR